MHPKKLSAYGHFIEENVNLYQKQFRLESYGSAFTFVASVWMSMSPEEKDAYITAYEKGDTSIATAVSRCATEAFLERISRS